jgi:lipoprotein NlpI
MTPDAVLAAAESPNTQMQQNQICEANFYSGELALQRGTKDEATRLFKLAVDGCPKMSIEYQSATAELKALSLLLLPD